MEKNQNMDKPTNSSKFFRNKNIQIHFFFRCSNQFSVNIFIESEDDRKDDRRLSENASKMMHFQTMKKIHAANARIRANDGFAAAGRTGLLRF